MQNIPLVTVICLCYNHEKFVIESLNSVINQTYKNIELLIADDRSTDDSVAVINKWQEAHPHVIFIANTVNLGNTKTFNTLFKLSNGEYIIDLAADDVLESNCVEQQIAAFYENKNSNVGIVYGNMELIDESNNHLGYYYPVDAYEKTITKPATGNIYLSVLSQNSKICSVTAMMKRSALEKLNGYDESLAFEDLDIWIRASRIYNFFFIDSILVKRRELSASLGSQFFIKNNKRTKIINYSSYLVIKKAVLLNETRQENKALLKRLHYEMEKAYKTRDVILFLKYIPIELRLRFR